MTVQSYSDLPPGRKAALKEMSKVNLAAAIVLGGEAGFDKESIIASAFSVVLSTLAAMGLTQTVILKLVKEVIPSAVKTRSEVAVDLLRSGRENDVRLEANRMRAKKPKAPK